jgi:hypothetical protein
MKTLVNFMSRRVLRVRNILSKRCRENQKGHFMFNQIFFFPENRAVCEITRKNIVEPDRPQVTL